MSAHTPENGLSDAERRDMHMALSDSYDDLDEFVHTLIADRVAEARAAERERVARRLLARLRPPMQAERAAAIAREAATQ